MAITIKTPAEIAIMREGGLILSEILNTVAAAAQPGVTTAALDELAKRLCREREVVPSCVGYHGYPSAICASVNDQVVHCIPGGRTLVEGDIIALDFVVSHRGFHTDACQSVAVGAISPEARKLLDVTKEALHAGLAQAFAGQRVGDISHAIESTVTPHGYSPVRETVGHGIGRRMHEDPEVPNWGRAGTGPQLKPGMTICIEPIINAGTYRMITERDGWTTRTADGALSAHFEYTVLITDGDPEVLTPWG